MDGKRDSNTGRELFDESQYNEEDDQDFVLEDGEQVTANVGSDIDDEDDYEENGGEDDSAKRQKVNYSSIENEQGGLIKTRYARKVEEELGRKQKYECLRGEGVSEETNNIWEDLQRESRNRSQKRSSIMSLQPISSTDALMGEEQVLIERSFKFANEVVHEKKWVPKSSAGGYEFLRTQKAKNSRDVNEVKKATNDYGMTLRRPLKRPPILEQIIAGALKPKLTTLEKSKLDWVAYVDKEGINEELTLHNKDGYLAKQDFLSRVETFKDNQYREMRRKQIQQND
ncbi:LAMI_0F08416g1_1 [Lachancea mirantina]|uniref:SWR1-complex protein 5 n=1 Tax=Lachancea mirantina TaxID=1230905 RepID=A0A1G4K0C4_9SACH|nr:LAMI_0F08416g1_1 [Lachancea mirantina]